MIIYNRCADDAEYQTGFAEYAKNNTRQLEPLIYVACSLPSMVNSILGT